ncbi:asparagine synthase (glutamine-hydrolyzing) [Alphaproteobacteria bacterium]|nr:asparagine synthase (glutamine-hydrolyzing) [Alphaproteobacteria bacterium]
MCGFSGIIGQGKEQGAQTVRQMLEIIDYRGPDSFCINAVDNCVFGHCRLAIIDLKIQSNQPFFSPNKRYCLVFNGEIYNYVELKKDLCSKGVNFRTNSDTEVLLHSLIEYGHDALDRLIGMFSGCFYDRLTKKAFLFRDNFGQKPIYYSTKKNGDFVFASEIKSILAAGIKAEPNFEAVNTYLHTADYDHSEATFFANIYQLLPGQSLEISNGTKKEFNRWYDVRKANNFHFGERSVDAALYELFLDAVEKHIRADVKSGLSLSGGFDSSALLALVNKLNHGSNSLRCYSVDFAQDLSEKDWIISAADQFTAPLSIVEYSRTQFQAALSPTMWHLEGPMGGLMNCALGPMFKRAKIDGVTVIHDGTGLDEIFGGYQNHHLLYLANLSQNGDTSFAQEFSNYCNSWIVEPKDVLSNIENIKNGALTSIDGTNPIQRNTLSPDLVFKQTSETEEQDIITDPVKRSLCQYLQSKKIPRNMRMKDRLSMAYSCELRLPFLDRRLVEFGLSLPNSMLFEEGLTKAIARKALKGVLNDKVRLAQKRSIQAPQSNWLMQDPMKSYLSDLISSKRFLERGIFDAKKCCDALSDFQSGQINNSFFIWQWINIDQWFRVFIEQDPVKHQYRMQSL